MSSRITSASRVSPVEIRTPSALAAIAKKFAPVILQDNNVPVPPSNSDYFSRMMLPTNIELDSGNNALYDVQFDTRFLINYILYHVTALYPEMNIKGHPFVTPMSLAGYCLTVFYAFLLATDKTFRPNASWQASRFLSDSDRKDLYDKLLQCYVPTFLSDLLLELCPVYDPRRNNHLFCPSLAGYLHLHDFGRTLPPSLFYQAHQLLASVRTNRDPDDVLDDFMALELITHNAVNYTTSNYLGTWYADGHHENFLNRDFLAFFNPLVGRALSARPTFARITLSPEPLSSAPDQSIYSALLLASDQNLPVSSALYDALSAFIHVDTPRAPQLGSVLSTLSGSLLLTHSVEPPTLPTWTAATYTQSASPTPTSDKKFAESHGFMAQIKAGTAKASFPDDPKGLDTNMYHVLSATDFDPTKMGWTHTKFDGKLSVIPSVLYVQPYDVSPASLGLTIAAGLKIELAEISGFMVPVEHPESSLDDNNSQYLQSAIRADRIHAMFSSTTAAQASYRLLPRDDLDRTNQGVMLTLFSTAKSYFPWFASNLLPARLHTTPADYGLTSRSNQYSTWTGFNVKAGSNGEIPGKDTSFYLWSSYRVVHKYKAPEPKDISMIASFRPTYGTNVTLSRSKNPSLIIPH